MNRYTGRVVFLILFIAFLTGCAINPVTGQKEIMFMSESQEIDMGKEFHPNALWGDIGGGGEFRDAHSKAYLKEIVSRIHSVSHRPYLPLQFAIQNSSVPNAWAIPGYVVMTRGLLAGLEEEIRQMIARTPPAILTGDRNFRERFQTNLTGLKRLNTLYLDYYDKAVRALQEQDISGADSYITQALSKDQSQPSFHTLKGMVMLKKKK